VNGWIALGKQCPRKLLINSHTALLDQPDARALENINTPQERTAALSLLS
jgi:molybdopterin-guanine dinucleotide biosynthesis protein A